MSPKDLPARSADRAQARSRLRIARKYLEVAEIAATEDGEAINVTVGLAVLAGIAASDAICIRGIGVRYSGSDHAAAADLLARVDATLGERLRVLVALKPSSHYGADLLTMRERTKALRAAAALVRAAEDST